MGSASAEPFAAGITATLIESADKQASFDPDGFSRRLLELTEAKGQA